jgi:hypothetical protein
MIIEIQAPKTWLPTAIIPTVFLAGSIEMGYAGEWQKIAIGNLGSWMCDRDVAQAVVFNPRRDDWDDSWVQSVHNANFNEQVNWELDNIEKADVVFFYFEEKTMSPITLLELGLCIGMKKKMVVAAHPDYQRNGNIRITCMRARIPVHKSLTIGLARLQNVLSQTVNFRYED